MACVGCDQDQAQYDRMDTDMSKDRVWVRNTLTGQTGVVPRKIFEHSVLSGGSLEEVEPRTKSAIPEMYHPREPRQPEPTPVVVPDTPDNRDSEDAE